MIETVAQLLDELKERELEKLKEYEYVRHTSMIGDMYEGLTRRVLDAIAFRNLDLRVVQGKIRDSKGGLSAQIDCMLVEGPGDQLPNTPHFVYDIAQVIATVEVKKRLYSSQLNRAHENLRCVTDLVEAQSVPSEMPHGAFRLIARKNPPASPGDLSFEEESVYSAILTEVVAPARIVFGYHGFVDEFSLRRAFTTIIGANMTRSGEEPIRGFGPTSLPNLVLCGQHALVKLNGLPYCSPLREGPWWPVVASHSGQNARLFVEVIWSRLAGRHSLPADIFGDDLEVEVFRPLLDARAVRTAEITGWEYRKHDIPAEELESQDALRPWEPLVIDEAQAVVFKLVQDENGMNLRGDRLRSIAEDHGVDTDSLLNAVLESGFVYLADETLVPLVEKCLIAFLPDGRIVIGDNATGRMARWIDGLH